MNQAIDTIRSIDLDKIDLKKYLRCYADCVILTHDHKILLQKRGKNWQSAPGLITAFGGLIEIGETPIQAIIRELAEELGAQVNQADLIVLGAVTENFTNHTELIYIYFWIDKHTAITDCYEGEPVYFDSINDIMEHPKVMNYVKWALNKCQQLQLL